MRFTYLIKSGRFLTESSVANVHICWVIVDHDRNPSVNILGFATLFAKTTLYSKTINFAIEFAVNINHFKPRTS